MAELASFWFLLGISIGVGVTCILWVTFSFKEWLFHEKELKKEKRKAHDEGYSRGRRFQEGQIEWFERCIDEIWYEIEELRKWKEKQNELCN